MSTAVPTQLIGRTLSNKYAIEALIGTGGMGAVFRARQIALDKLVAVKVLHRELADEPKFLERFQREALSASRLDHPNSLRVLDFGEDEGLVFLVMEYVPAEDLLAVMNREWPLDDARVAHILSQALAALAIAHDLGIVHRDLKPENILVLRADDDEGAPTEIVKVCDFGVAKMSPRTTRESDLFARSITTEGLAVGTPDYMSPEQARGEAVDGRSDLYSLGVVLYHLITGRTPFLGESALAVALQHVSDDPPPPSRFRDVHPELEAICMRALAKRPADRFQSAREMRRALRAAVQEPVTTSYSTAPFVLTRRLTTPSFTSCSDEPILRPSSPPRARHRRSASRVRQTVTAVTGGALIAATIAGSVPAARRELQRQVGAQWNVVEAAVAERLQAHSDIAEISADPTPMADFAPARLSPSNELDGGEGVREARAAPTASAPQRTVGGLASIPKPHHPSAMSGRPKLDPSVVSSLAGPRVPSADSVPSFQTTDAKLGPMVDSAALSASITAGAPAPAVASSATPAPALQMPNLQPPSPQPPAQPAAAPVNQPPVVQPPQPSRSPEPREGAGVLPFDSTRASVGISSISTSAGVLANKVRAALSRVPLALCYRQALRDRNAPIPLHAALQIAVDATGRVVTSTLSRDGNLPGLRSCIESQVRGAQVRDVDTGDGAATIDLTFTP